MHRLRSQAMIYSTTTSDSVFLTVDPNDEEFIPKLMEEFPHLYLAPETIKKMWLDHHKQTTTVKNCLAEDRRKKTKARSTVGIATAILRLLVAKCSLV